MMNYLMAIVEAEASLAARNLGLDAAMGVFHADQPHRESLSCDLMEPVRPQVDAYLLDWITTEPLRREWFFEQPNGNARLMSSLTVKLSETALIWARAVAPVAEWVAQALWDSVKKPPSEVQHIPTRLTQQRRTEDRGKQFVPPRENPTPDLETICKICGISTHGGAHCVRCGKEVSREKLMELAKVGRIAVLGRDAQSKRSESQRRHEAAKREWRKLSGANWPDQQTYDNKIQPGLASVRVATIASALGVSESYAADIRAGRRHPHPRHWPKLAKLVGVLLS